MSLIVKYLNKIPRKNLEKDFTKIVKKHIKEEFGIYALYNKRDKLVYVGQTRGRLYDRIKLHDRKTEIKWYSFSVYLVSSGKFKYINDLEALIHKIIRVFKKLLKQLPLNNLKRAYPPMKMKFLPL